MPQQCTIDRIKDVLSELQSLLEDKNEQGPNNKPVEEKRPSNKEQELVEWRRPSKNEQEPIEKPLEKKRSSSFFGWVTGGVRKRFKGKKETSNHGSDSGGGSQGGSRQSRLNTGKDEVHANLEKLRLQSDIHQMKTAFENLTRFQSTISKSLETDVPSNKLKVILEKTQLGNKSRARDLKEIRRKVLNLKGLIPSLLKKQSSIGLSITDSQTTEENGQMNEIVETGSDISLPGLHVSDDFKYSLAFEEVLEKFKVLEVTEMLCLLSFAVFPENKEVKRTMLMYWWIGEGFICDEDSENEVTKILDGFSREGLLEPVEDETKLKSSGYKMEPHVHSAVIYLAGRMELFNLYSSGKHSSGKLTMQKSKKENVCLVKGSSLQPKPSIQEPRNLKSIFNSSERYPDFTFKWFRQLESLKVLYLGRWERTAKRHIEVESTDFLRFMTSLKNLRLASFQGISRIENLKDLVCSLPKLVILDLRACYNLEALPDDIGSLESLIYLDVSECYMLDRMPTGIARLRKLQVLKGFVISQTDDEKNCVRKLEDLRKLSITVNKYNFKVEDFMESLNGLKQLKSLKIAWGARFPDEDRNEETRNEEKEKQREDDQVNKKGQTSQEKEGDGVSSKNEQGKKRDEVEAESLKSDKAVEGEKKISPSAEPTEKIQKKPEDQKGESKVDGDGDKGKADIEEGKKQDEIEAEKSKSDNGVGEVTKAGPSQEPTDMKQDDTSKAEKEANGDKGKKQDEVEAEKSNSGNEVGEVTKASPSLKPDDTSKAEKEANRDKGKKQDEVEAEKSNSGNGVGEVTKASPSLKPDDTNKAEKEANGDKGKKQDEVEAEKSNSGNGVGEVMKASPSLKPDDTSKAEKEANGNKGKKQDEVEAEKSKPDNGVEGVKKASPSGEPTEMKPDDKSKVEKEANGDKGKKQGEVDAEKSKPDNGVEGVKKASPSQEPTEMKPDDTSKAENDANGDKGKKEDEVDTEKSKSENGVEGVKKASPSSETTNTIENKPDGEKEKANLEEGKKKDEVKAESSKQDKLIEGDEKTSPSKESEDTVKSKPDDHQRGDKQEEKGDGEKEKANLEEGKKTDEVKEERSKPDKAIEGDEKTCPSKESEDNVKSKPDDHTENSKAQEKGDGEKIKAALKKPDGGEAKTQKSDKNKLGHKVSFSEEPRAPVQKKPDDMAKENHETASTSRSKKTATKESGSRLARLFFIKRHETKKPGKEGKEDSGIDTSKLPPSLKKLELECFPYKKPPIWLNPKTLDNLEKLSIKGGKLRRFSDEPKTAENKCAVQILRLKYLHEFKAEWKDLQTLFPHLKLLEKYKCPEVAFCPTDGNGVWRLEP